MSHGLEIYEGTATESAGVARITVRKGVLMVLTRAAVDLLGEDVTHVQRRDLNSFLGTWLRNLKAQRPKPFESEI